MYKYKFLFFTFVGVSIVQLLSVVFAWSFLHHLSKPLLMPLLMWMYFYHQREHKTHMSGMVLFALFFSFLGDTFLMYTHKSEMYFMTGLASFLLAHVCYIFAYRQHRYAISKQETTAIQKLRLAFPIVLAGTGLIIVLYPHLGQMLMPVAVYTLIIIIMTLVALGRLGRTSLSSFWLVLSGALLFMLSDSMLAINKFLHAFSAAGFLIMFTYILAQYLIVEGLVRHK